MALGASMIERFILSALAAAACGCSSTTIQSSWTDPTFSGTPFGRIAVVALFDSEAESRTFEENAAAALDARGVDAIPSYAILGDDGRVYEQEELKAELARADVDGILIYRLIAVDERNVYRDPGPYMRVPGTMVWGDPYYWYYYPRWDYYWHWRSSLDVTRSQDYWEPLAYMIVESSLFDARRDRLVWTAKSETIDGAKFASVADSIVAKVTGRLAAMNVIASRASDRDGGAASVPPSARSP
jgi:hypothetical protein